MYDPIMIYGFSIVHLVVPTIVLGFLMPSWFNWIIPSVKIPLGDKLVAPMETIDHSNEIMRVGSEESGVAPYTEPKMEEAKQ
jgi:solute carrier family 6 GABA transporter-like protein 1